MFCDASGDAMTNDIPDHIHTAPLQALGTTPLDKNPAVVYLSSLSEGSRPTMRTALNTMAAMLGVAEHRDPCGSDVRYLDVSWSALRYQHTSAMCAQLQARYAPATATKLLAALRRVLREARRLGQISADDYERATDLGTIRAERQPRGRLVTEAEVVALLRICADDSSPAGARDAAIIALLYGTGLRRAEAVALDLADCTLERGTLIVRGGPRTPSRLVYVPSGTHATMRDWLMVRGAVAGPLFYGVVKGGALMPRRLAAQAMAVICAHRAAEAGIPSLTPHDLRRTFMSGLLDAGIPIAVAQHLAGHADQATTVRYDRRDEDAKQRAVRLVYVPHFPRTVDRDSRCETSPKTAELQ